MCHCIPSLIDPEPVERADSDNRELLTDEMSSELPNNAKPLASLLISKVYFYMNIQDEAVEFALSAGSAFQQEPEGEYRETIIAGCLDRAIQQTAAGETMSPKLSAIVDGVLRSGSSENGKLVRLLLGTDRLLTIGYGFGFIVETARLDRNALPLFPRSAFGLCKCFNSTCP